MKANLNLLKDINRQLRAKVRPIIGTSKAGETIGRGAGGDKTKYIDKLAEDSALDILRKHRISCTVISEEQGIVEISGGSSETYFIIDSIDGTSNALRDIPFFALSIAIADGPRLSRVHTSLVSNFKLGEVFTAEKGKGAWHNGYPITPSNITRIEEALLVINSSPSREISPKIVELIKRTHHARCFGSIALELCYVASGKLDGLIDLRQRIRFTDIAASFLIIKEARGCIVDSRGNDLDSSAVRLKRRISFLASGNKLLLKKMEDILL